MRLIRTILCFAIGMAASVPILADAIDGPPASSDHGTAAESVPEENLEDAPEITLEDQHREEHHIEFPREKPTILVFADRKGSKQLEGWLMPLHERYGEQVHLQGIAKLDSVPGPFRWLARRAFKSGMDSPVMLDFEGDVCEAYGFVEDQANLFVISPSGKIALHILGGHAREHAIGIQDALAQWNVAPEKPTDTPPKQPENS